MFETMIFDRLLALGIASHEILRIRIPDGRVERLYDGTGRAPDGIVMIGDSVYWTTMGASMRDPDIPGEAGRLRRGQWWRPCDRSGRQQPP